MQVPVKYMSAFSASKYALAGFTEAVRAEVEPLGVHIGQVRKWRNPGGITCRENYGTKLYY